LATATRPTATVENSCRIGFQRGHPLATSRERGYRRAEYDRRGTSFAFAIGGVLTLFIAAPPNGSSVWVRVVDEVSGAIFEQEITADLPVATKFEAPLDL
jgi:hypothetical protein